MTSTAPMTLTVVTPTETLVDAAPAVKLIAQGSRGAFCILPRHQDWVEALTPGLLRYVSPGGDGGEHYLGVDEGLLVKQGRQVLVSTRQAVAGDDLEALRRTVDEVFRARTEHEQRARVASARLEASFVRRFLELDG